MFLTRPIAQAIQSKAFERLKITMQHWRLIVGICYTMRKLLVKVFLVFRLQIVQADHISSHDYSRMLKNDIAA